MKAIIGYGNILRGEDGFGVEVIERLHRSLKANVKLISTHSLTPELVLELLEADEIVFVDASYDPHHPYALACSTLQANSHLSHHIQPQMLIFMLQNIYNKQVSYTVYSMLTDSFDHIDDASTYNAVIGELALYLQNEYV